MTTAAQDAASIHESLKAYDAAIAELAPYYERAERTGDYSYVDEVSTTIHIDYTDVFADAVRRYTDPRLWNIEAMQAGDKRDLELTCTLCKEHLCDVEPSDILAVLFITAIEHLKDCPGSQNGDELL